MSNLVEDTIKKYRLLTCGDSVIIALSGGADSVTLLDVLYSLREKYNLRLFAAHVNHNLRGEEALRDENFCKVLCENYNIELFVRNVDVKSLASRNKISEELCGRNVRYEFFNELSEKLNAKVATAHTASDNAETLIFNIARGCSVSGIGAIPPVRGNIIRPLIEVTRTWVENYCREHNLKYVTDSTNLTDEYTRNTIRHNVIPVLQNINPEFDSAASRLSQNAREIAEHLAKMAEKALIECKTEYGYDCRKLAVNDAAVLKSAVVRICKEQAGFNPEQRHIDLLTGIIKSGGSVELNSRFIGVSKQGILRIIEKNSPDNFSEVEFSEKLSFEYNKKQYSVKEINQAIEKNQCLGFDCKNINAVFRTRHSNDKFTYLKRNITKPLRKVMNEMKIPSELRDNLIVLAADNTVLWCEGIGVSKQGSGFCGNRQFIIDIKCKN